MLIFQDAVLQTETINKSKVWSYLRSDNIRYLLINKNKPEHAK